MGENTLLPLIVKFDLAHDEAQNVVVTDCGSFFAQLAKSARRFSFTGLRAPMPHG